MPCLDGHKPIWRDNSGVSEPTIARLEAADGDLGGRETTGQKIRDAIEAAGIQFFEENGGARVRAFESQDSARKEANHRR